MDINEINTMNAGALAYLGDSVYEQEIRSFLVKHIKSDSNKLQKESIKYVSAINQAMYLDIILEKEILTKEELYTVNRARNYKTNSKPKYTDIKTYKKATALEALFGMLYLNNNNERIKELIKVIIGE